MKNIICLYGGPGTGKSTTCSGLFYRLKQMGFTAEMVREYVKDWVWEGRKIQEGDQTYFFAKQSRKERALIRNELDFIVTDSPLILTHFYGIKYDWLEQNFNTSLVMLKHHHEFCKKHGYKIEHFFIEREKPYVAKGRNESEETARQYDSELKDLLKSLGIKYQSIPDSSAVHDILLALEVFE